MQRYDLRHLKSKPLDKMGELMSSMESGEVSIFMFEIGDFSIVQSSNDLAIKLNCEVMNSLKYNEVDWTLVVKKR
jgi:NADH-quinone oxidoreductase subunit E